MSNLLKKTNYKIKSNGVRENISFIWLPKGKSEIILPVLAKFYESADHALVIQISRDTQDIRLSFQGKSQSRDPGIFINPILKDVLQEAQENKKNIVLDFCNMTFMNSAAVAPIIKFWASVKGLNIGLTLEYDESLSWQKTSFSGFVIFEKESPLFTLRAR